MENIKSFNSYLEDSKIYESSEMSPDSIQLEESDRERQNKIYKTWIEDYFIPIRGLSFREESPELKALIASAKAWLSSQSGIVVTTPTKRTFKYTNGEIVYGIYWERKYSLNNAKRFPMMASLYSLIKPTYV